MQGEPSPCIFLREDYNSHRARKEYSVQIYIQRRSMNADLTVGTPWKVLLKYTLPLFGGAVFQQLYTLADTIIAGRFAGQTALTAIGASNSIV